MYNHTNVMRRSCAGNLSNGKHPIHFIPSPLLVMADQPKQAETRKAQSGFPEIGPLVIVSMFAAAKEHQPVAGEKAGHEAVCKYVVHSPSP